ncbi:protein AF-9-like [Phalaenopsis equestris]|uniref:protein AF-9-like n=1 Tax=Phalaenopsis equestris TaxID=78828 RepID=UPI0009E51D0C|nr:protein AF-9-like [Phalaenopsis equestris]
MGRPEKEGRCMRHPIHKHSNGVCPYCLYDRLSDFSTSSSSSTNKSASSTSSSTVYYSSYDSELSSMDVSPPHEKLMAESMLKQLEMLRKSKSVGFDKEAERGQEEEKKKMGKKGRFWIRFMMGGGGRRKQREVGLSHSKTMKEKSSHKWTNFFS